jgi:hypothetical protein
LAAFIAKDFEVLDAAAAGAHPAKYLALEGESPAVSVVSTCAERRLFHGQRRVLGRSKAVCYAGLGGR